MVNWSDSDKRELMDKIEYEGGVFDYFLYYASPDEFKGTEIYKPLLTLIEASENFQEIFDEWVDTESEMEYDDEDENES